jgi:hypothetical protein
MRSKLFGRFAFGWVLAVATMSVMAQNQKQEEPKPIEPPTPSQESLDDPVKLKAQIAELQAKVVELELKVTSNDLEKLGAIIDIETPKEGPRTSRVTLPKTWRGDATAIERFKALPELRVIYIDCPAINNEAISKLKELKTLNAITIMSPAVTDASLEHLKDLPVLDTLFLTGSKIGDAGLVHLKDVGTLKEISLSKTDVTDAGLATLGEFGGLKTIYLIGTKVTDEGVNKLKQSKPDARVIR